MQILNITLRHLITLYLEHLAFSKEAQETFVKIMFKSQNTRVLVRKEDDVVKWIIYENQPINEIQQILLRELN